MSEMDRWEIQEHLEAWLAQGSGPDAVVVYECDHECDQWRVVCARGGVRAVEVRRQDAMGAVKWDAISETRRVWAILAALRALYGEQLPRQR